MWQHATSRYVYRELPRVRQLSSAQRDIDAAVIAGGICGAHCGRARVEPQIARGGKTAFEKDAHFEPRKRGSGTDMDTRAVEQVFTLIPLEPDFPGCLEHRFVPVGRCPHHMHGNTRGNAASAMRAAPPGCAE